MPEYPSGLGLLDAKAPYASSTKLPVYNLKDNAIGNLLLDGTTDETTAMNTLIAAVAAAGGGLLVGKGRLRTTGTVNWASKVGLAGFGRGLVLAPEGSSCPIQKGGTLGSPLLDLFFEDFEIDCSLQTGLVKGMFLQFVKRMVVRGVYMHDSGASGFGCDYLVDSIFEECVVENAGRNGLTSSPGCSGFGIGVGQYAVENTVLLACIARSCKRYGAFYEQLSGASFYSTGMKILGGRFESNNRGVGDNGAGGLLVDDADIISNVDAGFYLGQDQGLHPGKNGVVSNSRVLSNGSHGVSLDWTADAQNGLYAVKGNRVESNTGVGVKLTGSGTVPNVSIKDNGVALNGSIGIQVSAGATAFNDLVIARNEVRANGTAGSATEGIRIGSACLRPRITHNKCWDDGGSPTQTYGLRIDSITLTNGSIADNDLTGNVTGPLLNSGTLTNTSIRDNPGYNPVGWDSITLGASPYTYVAGPTYEEIHMLNGTVSNVAVTEARTGTTTNVAISAPNIVPLGPGDTAVFTYSVLPATKRWKR